MDNRNRIQSIAAAIGLMCCLMTGCRSVVLPPGTPTDRETSPYEYLSMELDSSRFTAIGQTAQLRVFGIEKGGGRVDLTDKPQTRYSSSRGSVATVNATGLITATGQGQADIHVVYNYGTGLLKAFRTISVVVEASLVSIEVSPSSITFTSPADGVQLTVIGQLSDGTSRNLTSADAGTTYEVADPAVANVTANGRVTPVSNGSTTITVRHDVFSASIPVLTRFDSTSPSSQLTGMVIQPAEINFQSQGQTQQLQVLGTFRTTDSQGLVTEDVRDITSALAGTTYRTSDPLVATVSNEGLVTAVMSSGSGEAIVTAANNNIEAEAHVRFQSRVGDGEGPPDNGGAGTGQFSMAWINRDQPVGRNSHALCFDSARNVGVLFGGYDGGILGDTWEWDGAAGLWTRVSSTGPSARYAHGLVYDSRRRVSVLVGGTDGQASFRDTWEWNGLTWRLASSNGIAPIGSHATAYDSIRGVTVVFGGVTNGDTLSGITWEWNGVAWKQVADRGPTPRLNAAMAFDPVRGVTVLFGGDTDGTNKGAGSLSNETWEWDGQSWLMVQVAGPSPRAGHAMAFDSVAGRIVLHGGWTGAGQSSETWVYDGQSWNLLTDTAPSGRTAHAMAFATNRNETILFGGTDDVRGNSGETWVLRAGRWLLAADSIRPTPRHHHVMTYDDVRGVTVLFGGYDGNYSDETWEWNGKRWTKRTPQQSPGTRSTSAMTFDTFNGTCVVFGGRTGNGLSNATWSWNGNEWTQLAASGPTPREGHSMVYDPRRSCIVLFGGTDGRLKNDTWEWNGAQWQRVSTSGPAPRSGASMIYDRNSGQVILFGGFGDAPLSDIWTWDGVTWTKSTAQGPSGRSGHASVFDFRRNVLLLFGGLSGQNAVNDVWTWNGVQWFSPLMTTSPGGRYQHAMAYDQRRGVVVLFGGFNGMLFDDTWELPAPR